MALEQQKFDLIASAKTQLSNQNRGWSQRIREGALRRLSNIGLPNHRDEYWKYTNPAELLTENLSHSSVAGLEDPNVFSEIDTLKIVFCDGIFSSELSDDLTSENIEISRLADVGDLHWAQNYYGVLEEKGQNPVNRPLAAFNTAMASDGALINIKGDVKRPILIF